MRLIKYVFGLSVAMMAMGSQSCTQARPENESGHNLWLGDITAPVVATNSELLSQYDKELGDEGFRIKQNDINILVVFN